MAFYESFCIVMGPYKPLVSLWVFMGFYRSFCVLMDSNGFLCVRIGPYACL